jgi:hypothetical protein
MAGLGITYQAAGGAGAASISPATGPVGTVFSVALPAGATCQWSLNGTPISGATSSTYTSAAAGTLTCAVTLAGVTVSAVVTLAALVLSTTSFAPGVSQGSLLATISGQTSGSTVSIASSDTTGYFAVSSSGLVAGLNYGALAAGATPTVQLTETLAGAANSPNLTTVGVTVSAATVVSASNRCRLGRQSQSGSTKPTTYQYLNNNSVHTTVVSIMANTLQPYYFNGYTNGQIDSQPASQVMTLRGAYITNLQGAANIGTTGASLNQTGATLTTWTWNGIVSGATQIYGDTTGANCAQPRTYAQFLADGGSVTTTTYTNDTIIAPPGYIFAPDPLASALAAGASYILRSEVYCPLNAYFIMNAIMNYGASLSPSHYNLNPTGDYSKAYNSSTQGAQTGGTGLPMVFDPNWSTYGGVSNGTADSLCPIWVIGQNAGGAKTHVVAGCSILEGNLDYGDGYGNSGLVQRALFNKGLPHVTTAIVGSLIQQVKTLGVTKAMALRMLAFRIFTAGGGDIITDDGRNDTGLGWPTAGTYTAASPDDTTQPANDMAAIRWLAKYHMRPNMSASSKLIRVTSISPGETSSSFANAATISGATYSGTTITYTVNSTANLINGETVQIRGMAPSVYNAYGAITIINATTFSMVASAAPTAAPTTPTGTVDDGGQSAAGIPANTATTWLAGGAGYLMNDYSMSRNSYAGQTLSPAAGDFNGVLDCDGALGYYSQSNPAVWPVASSFQSETPEFTHTGWGANQRAMPTIAAALAGVL